MTRRRDAISRDRFHVSGDGIGSMPRDWAQRRIWLSLRDALVAPTDRDDVHVAKDRRPRSSTTPTSAGVPRAGWGFGPLGSRGRPTIGAR